MPPKRKSTGGRGRGRAGAANKKAKATTETSSDAHAVVEKLLSTHNSYCEELGIDIANGGSQAAFQWLCCSIVFGNRISEKTTIRAATGLIKSGLTDPKSVKDTDLWAKIEALNSEGSVQRGPSMSKRMEETAAAVLEKYEGDLDKLREAAGKDPEKEQQLVKEFKGFGDTAVNIFCREVQLNWQELFPFADDRTLEMATKHGLPGGSAKELVELVENDKAKFVQLLAAIVKAELRGDPKIEDGGEGEEPSNDGKTESEVAEQPAGDKGANDVDEDEENEANDAKDEDEEAE